jgi:HD superfamily phosphohydrolase
MSKSKKDNLIKGKVEYFKKKAENHTDIPQLFVAVDEESGFSEEEEIVVLKCSEFPELTSVKNSVELRRKIEDHTDNLKRVRELKQKLESAQEAHKESLNVLKIKTDLEIENLKEENTTLKNENKELSLRLKDVTRRINELNNLLNDL